MTLIRVILVAILVISPLVSSARAVAAEKTKKTNVYTGKEGAACHVVAGDNKGKSGTYDSEGDCAGDFGATVCTTDGKSNGKCADGARTGSIRELLRDILLDQVLLFKDQQRDQQAILKVLDQIHIKLDNLQVKVGVLQDFCSTVDLVPQPDPTLTIDPLNLAFAFCRLDTLGKLHVVVLNQGGAQADPSKTRVEFGCGDPSQCSGPSFVDLDTPALAGSGGSVDLGAIDIPTGCADTNSHTCTFRISADVNNAVAENNELNNIAVGQCFFGRID